MSDNKKVYPVIIRDFLRTKQSRIVITSDDLEHPALEEQWLVLQDMFEFAGKLNNGQIRDEHRKKVVEFLEDMGWIKCYEKFVINSDNQGVGRHTVELECIRLDVVDMLITQNVFKPKKGSREYTMWIAYMHHIKTILEENQALKELNLIDATEERLTKPFEDVLLTSAQVAKMAECRTGTQLVEILEKMGVITYKGKDIVSWEEKYFRCTKRTVKIKYNSASELVEKVKEYMVKYNIVPYVKRKTRRKQVHCIDTGITYSCAGDANEAFGKDRDNSLISACCRGEVPSAYGHKWEYVED